MLVSSVIVRPFQSSSNLKFGAKTPNINELEAEVAKVAKRFAKHPYNRSLEAELRDAKKALEEALKK